MNKSLVLWLATAALMTAIAACSKKESASPPSTPIADAPTEESASIKYRPLMQALFGSDYRVANDSALTALADPDNDGEEAQFVVEAISSTVLATGETVLVTNAVPADEEGNPSVDHASSGKLGIYVLTQSNQEWKVTLRYDNLDALGSSGNAGTPKWVQLGPNKTGLVMLHGGTWMGYTLQLMSIYSIAADKVERLSGEQPINMESDSNGACTPDIECWDIHGDWQFVGKSSAPFYDLSIAFSGERSAATGGDEDAKTAEPADAAESKRESKPVTGNAVYRYQDGEYKLLSGENIVPSI